MAFISQSMGKLVTGLALGCSIAFITCSSASAQAPKPETLSPGSVPASGEAPATAAQIKPVQAQAAPATPAPSMQRLALASVVVQGEKVDDGDLIQSSRYYGDWRLSCDEIVSKERRNCRLEQDLAIGNKWALSWKLVESSQKKPFFLIQFPASVNTERGLHLIINGFIREFKVQEWACVSSACEVYVPADKTAQQLIFGATSIQFRYYRGNDAIETSGSLRGFNQALNALAEPKAPEITVASAGPVEVSPKKPAAPRKKPEPQFEALRQASDPVPDALKKIYGVE